MPIQLPDRDPGLLFLTLLRFCCIERIIDLLIPVQEMGVEPFSPGVLAWEAWWHCSALVELRVRTHATHVLEDIMATFLKSSRLRQEENTVLINLTKSCTRRGCSAILSWVPGVGDPGALLRSAGEVKNGAG